MLDLGIGAICAALMRKLGEPTDKRRAETLHFN
jgi:hypothetical protein